MSAATFIYRSVQSPLSVCLCFKARAYNCQIRPAMLDSSSRVKWTNTAHQPAHLVGEEVSTCV